MFRERTVDQYIDVQSNMYLYIKARERERELPDSMFGFLVSPRPLCTTFLLYRRAHLAHVLGTSV